MKTINTEELYKLFLENLTVSTDSRNCPKNSMFFALKGENFNGNKFAKQALDNGAKYAIVDEEEYADLPNTLLVENALKTLQDLANYHRKMFKIPIIGITGTNGKTTTKELLLSILSKEYNVIATQGNYNNHIGVPLTLLRINKKHEIAIIEMGANHVGNIAELANIAEPNYGLITNIGRAHLEGFGSFENIIKAKGELYDFIRTIPDGKVFVDYDNSYLKQMSEGMTCIYYGLEEDLFVSGKVLKSNPYLEFEWQLASHKQSISTKMIGSYNLSNALAAITISKYLGVKSDLIGEAISSYEPTNSRSQMKETDRNMLIVDAYNANPTSMLAALENFDKLEVSRKVLIVGDMKELGPDTDAEHQKTAHYIESHKFQEAYLIGDNFMHVKTKLPCFKTFDDFRKYIEEHPIVDSYVLLKGSRSMKLEQCIDLL